MVAISMYKGNLHKVPDIPRKWQMPPRTISLKDFKILYRRRARALARLSDTPSTDIATSSIPETTELENAPPAKEVENKLDGVDCVEKQDEKETEEVDANPNLERNKKEDIVNESDKVKTIQEIEERLHILTEKKHGLVKILKQILTAEEELKRRDTMHHTHVALHVDTTTHDSSSTPRLNTPKTGQAHMNSPSPTPQSHYRKPAFNVVVKQPSGIVNSPSQSTPGSKDGRFSSPWN